MESKYVLLVAVLVVSIWVGIAAFNIGTYSKTYQFSSATPLNDGPGTVVFHLVDGKDISFQNAYAREDVSASEMAAGGYIVVQYSFIGYPVQVDYRA